MTSNTTRSAASSKKEEIGKGAFKGREILPPDRLSVEDLQRALHDEFDIGCAVPRNEAPQSCGNIDFDHHLF
ncbi:MAG: hypothetical protein AB1529_00540 [Candidatus Micrarchaeota archaeon]